MAGELVSRPGNDIESYWSCDLCAYFAPSKGHVHLWCRDVEDDEEATPWKEQENWEADQIKKASMKVGSKDRKGKKEYDLVLQDQIEFITDMVMAGDVVRPFSFRNTSLKQACFWNDLL